VDPFLFETIVRRRRLSGSVIPSTFRIRRYEVAHTLVLEADPFSKPSKKAHLQKRSFVTPDCQT
jgi:hypothetical protein